MRSSAVEASMVSKFNDEIQQVIIDALLENPSVPSAASKAGISAATLRKWIHEGEEGVELYRAFAINAQEARHTLKDEVVKSMAEIATDPLHPQATKAAHLLLTNLYPTEFATVKHTVAHKAEDPELDLSKLSQAEKRAFHAQLKKIVSGGDDDAPSEITVLDVSTPKAEA
jgi:transposase-like protein